MSQPWLGYACGGRRRACLLCLAGLWRRDRVGCSVGRLGRLACPDGALLQQVGRVLPAHRHHAGRQRRMHSCTVSHHRRERHVSKPSMRACWVPCQLPATGATAPYEGQPP